MPDKGKGIEIGVGTGRFAQKLNIEYGLDPSENMLKKARKRGIKTVRASAEKIPFKENYFDYALNVVTICFVEDPLEVLKETYRILKKEGVSVVGFIPKESTLGRYYLKKKESPFYKEARFYTFNEIKEFMKKAGFKYEGARELLFKKGDPPKAEDICSGYSSGGFVAIRGIK